MYLFNPDNDLALANFSSNYTPPASALKIAKDLAILPLWYAPAGSKIIAEEALNAQFLLSIKESFPIHCSLIPFSSIVLWQQNERITPWGWNPALRKNLLEHGVEEKKLPSLSELAELRQYSSRLNAVKMLRELQEMDADYCGESSYFDNFEALSSYLSISKGDLVLKMPNSGSGKGLVWIKKRITDKQTDWCKRVIREQGGVVAEPVLNKRQDFAMEFFAESGAVHFAGYSLFKSAPSGAYRGNRLLSDANIEKELSHFVQPLTLHQLQSRLKKKLAEYFPHYTGCLGVDMMICDTQNGFQIQPCVEINMRMNMGMVAHIFYERFVKNSSSGKFAVDFFKETGEALAYYQKMKVDFPAIIEKEKIKSGYLNLTPIDEDTHYVAWVKIESNHKKIPHIQAEAEYADIFLPTANS